MTAILSPNNTEMKSIFGNHHFWVHLSENDSLKDLHTGQLYLNVRIGAAGPLQIIFQTVHGESRRVIPLIITLLDKNTLIKRLSCLLIKATTTKKSSNPTLSHQQSQNVSPCWLPTDLSA